MTDAEIRFLVKIKKNVTHKYSPDEAELVRVFCAGGYLGVYNGEVALTVKGQHMLDDQLSALACDEVGSFVAGSTTRKVEWRGVRWRIPTWEVEVYGRKIWVGLCEDGKLAEIDEP